MMTGDSSIPPSLDRVIEGRWRLLSKLGEGGMGAVYLAEQLSIRGRKVAVKLLRAEFAQNPEFLRRFRGEAERAAAVSDPRVVMVLDFGQTETGELFLVMEYVVGETLGDLMKRGRLPLQRALTLGAQLADALHCVHEAGIIHRDVKPANAMIRQGSDDLKLMDFGIARSVDDQEHTHLTQSGIVVGTPAFMAPEQVTGAPLSRQTDIYAWGVVMYAMLAGKRPFEASSATAVQYMHVHEPPPPLTSACPDAPPEVERIVMRALAKNPEDRPRTMAEVATALRAIRVGEPGDWAATQFIPAAHTTPQQSPAAPTKPRSRTGLLLGATATVAAIAAVAALVMRDAKAPSDNAAVGAVRQPAVVAATPATVSASPPTLAPPVAKADASPSQDVIDALALSRFFLDRGEYDSAVEELEKALKAAPNSDQLKEALAAAQKAKAAEEAVLGR